MDSDGLRLGVTLFSFSRLFHSHQYSFDQLLTRIAELQLGPGLEIDGFQSIRGLPHISTEFERHFKRFIERTGLEPSCLDAFPDVARRPDRLIDAEEEFVFLRAQVKAASILGFTVVWMPALVPPTMLEKLLPFAERWNVTIGVEIGAPLTLDGPEVMAFRELFDRVASPHLGFIPDFGGSTTELAPGALQSLRENGVPSAIIDLLAEVWAKDKGIREKREELVERSQRLGAGMATIGQLMPILSLFGREHPEAWLNLMPYVVHIHGKFYEFDADGEAVAIPYAELLPLFQRARYRGFMSLEWGGQLWTDSTDAFTVVGQQHAMCRRLLAA
jgi:hypothetical protein